MKAVLKVSLKEFICTGSFGSVQVGMKKTQVESLLGIPDGYSSEKTHHAADIWVYGDIQFFFGWEVADELWLIHWDWWGVPTGGRGIDLDPWIIHYGVSRKEIEEELKRYQINYSDSTRSTDNSIGAIRISIGVGVELGFCNDEGSEKLDGLSFSSLNKKCFPEILQDKNTALMLEQEIVLNRLEQDALIPVLREKWRSFAYLTERIDRQKASVAAKEAYEIIGEKEPEIFFFDNPYLALSTIVSQPESLLNNGLEDVLESQLCRLPTSRLESQQEVELDEQLQEVASELWEVGEQLWNQLTSQVAQQGENQLWNQLANQLRERLESQQGQQLKWQLKDAVWEQLWDELWYYLTLQLGEQLKQRLTVEVWDQLWDQLWNQLTSQLEQLEPRLMLIDQLWNQLWNQLTSQLEDYLNSQVREQLESQLGEPLKRRLKDEVCEQKKQLIEQRLGNMPLIKPELWASYGSRLDFYFSVLNCPRPQRRWGAFQMLVKNCGWIFPFKGTCFICDRPIKLPLDSEQRLHAEGEPAIQFVDGYRVTVKVC